MRFCFVLPRYCCFSRCFIPVIYRRGVRYGACSCFFFFFFFFFRQLTPRDAPPCVCLPLSLLDLIAVLLSLLLDFFRCVAHSLSLSLTCLPIWVVLHCLYMYVVAFLALRVLYVVALVYFAFVSWFFPLKPLPGDDVLCMLLPRPLPSVCFLPCLFDLFCFVFPDRVRPRFILV